MSEVYVKYSDFLNSVPDEISFELLTDINLSLKYDKEMNMLTMSMKDKITLKH